MEPTKPKEKRKPHLTPICPCRWAKLLTPDTRYNEEGEFSVHLCMTREQVIEFKKQHAAEVEAMRLAAIQNNPKFKTAPVDWPIRADEDEDGNKTGLGAVVFKQKQKPGYDFSVQVVDSQKNPWPVKLLIGNGSKIRVSFSIRVVPNGFNGKMQVCLHPQAVQVVDLVKYERNFGFDAVEGGVVVQEAAAQAPAGEYQGEPEAFATDEASTGNSLPDESEIPF